ncbi:MAG TPA: hypothetical protein VHX18_03410 [Rhizomicrobium sp.]|nr:hypothetical protein [Rhizomicrobium sp.]
MLPLVPLRALHFWKMGLARLKSLSGGGLGTCRAALKSLSRGPLGTIICRAFARQMMVGAPDVP